MNMSIAQGMCPAHMMPTNTLTNMMVLIVRIMKLLALELAWGNADSPILGNECRHERARVVNLSPVSGGDHSN